MENSTQLYTWTVNETQNFGVRIGTTRDGKAVMEMKGTGKIELIAPSDLEEVLPYTVHVRSLYENGISKHIIIEDTEFLEVGDVIAVPRGGLFQVIELDTKNKRALPFESYRKVLMVEPKK